MPPPTTDLAGRTSLVWGLGRHGGGLAAARYLADRGAEVAFLDAADPADLGEAAREAAERGWEIHRGDATHPAIRDADLVVCSPAIPPRAYPTEADLLARFTSPVALFCAAHAGPRIAVTGTKGKSTTASILGALLDRPAGGNSHEPLLDILAREGPDVPVVCELSSFQLWQLRNEKTHFDAVGLTRLDVDHLDWHGDAAHYRQAKLALLDWSDRRCLPLDLAAALGVVATLAPATWGAGGFRAPDGEPICPLSALRLLGDHMRDNACVAIGLALDAGTGSAAIAERLPMVEPLPHRLQTVHVAENLRFVDDSIATTPEAAIAGIQAIDGPVAVILGGSDKGVDFAGLAAAIASTGARPILTGATAPRIAAALAERGIDAPVVDDLATAVTAAVATLAGAGTVLLSPACASFDAFTSFEERGLAFADHARRCCPGDGRCS